MPRLAQGAVMRPYYQDESVTLYHGDCLEILPELEPVDHVITDPPYAQDVYLRLSMPNTKPGSGTPARVTGGHHITLKNGSAITRVPAGSIGAIDELLRPAAKEVARLTRRWGIVFSDVESTHLWRAALEDAEMRYVRTGAWVKPDAMPQMSGDRPAVGFEPCTIVHAQGAMRWNGGGNRAVWTFNTAKGSDRPDHPCPKPLPLMRALVEQFTDPGETILDPFAGSGTTLRAAKDLGRKAIGIELDEEWCEGAAKRMSQTAMALS